MVLALVAVLTTALLAMPTSASAAYTLSERTARAKQVAEMSLSSFMGLWHRYQSQTPTDIDATLTWSDYDGCSGPGPESWDGVFRKACLHHDFGYRNLGNGYFKSPRLALDSSNDRKKMVDDKFHAEMKQICSDRDLPDCGKWAYAYHQAVRKGAERQWHRGECHDGKLCLFKDVGFDDIRWMFSQSHPSMDPFSFHDQADSLWNNSSRYWIAYEDEDYGDNRLCIQPGAKVDNIDDDISSEWGDQIDSLRLLPSGSTC